MRKARSRSLLLPLQLQIHLPPHSGFLRSKTSWKKRKREDEEKERKERKKRLIDREVGDEETTERKSEGKKERRKAVEMEWRREKGMKRRRRAERRETWMKKRTRRTAGGDEIGVVSPVMYCGEGRREEHPEERNEKRERGKVREKQQRKKLKRKEEQRSATTRKDGSPPPRQNKAKSAPKKTTTTTTTFSRVYVHLRGSINPEWIRRKRRHEKRLCSPFLAREDRRIRKNWSEERKFAEERRCKTARKITQASSVPPPGWKEKRERENIFCFFSSRMSLMERIPRSNGFCEKKRQAGRCLNCQHEEILLLSVGREVYVHLR